MPNDVTAEKKHTWFRRHWGIVTALAVAAASSLSWYDGVRNNARQFVCDVANFVDQRDAISFCNRPSGDPVVYSGIADYYEEHDLFLSRLNRLSTRDEGRYRNPEIQEHYAKLLARLNTLLLRVEAHDGVEDCPQDDLQGQQVLELFEMSIELYDEYSDIEWLRPEFDWLSIQTERSSCTAIAVSLIRFNHLLLEAIHQEEEILNPFIIEFARRRISSSVRIALNSVTPYGRD